MAAASRTIDHEEIRGWVERNGGHPARVSRARGKDEVGMLHVVEREGVSVSHPARFLLDDDE